MKCFWKAHCVGDIEGGIALLKLAKLYEQINDEEQAAAAYTQVVNSCLNQISLKVQNGVFLVFFM